MSAWSLSISCRKFGENEHAEFASYPRRSSLSVRGYGLWPQPFGERYQTNG
jgi:hypothetical protein